MFDFLKFKNEEKLKFLFSLSRSKTDTHKAIPDWQQYSALFSKIAKKCFISVHPSTVIVNLKKQHYLAAVESLLLGSWNITAKVSLEDESELTCLQISLEIVA